MRPLAPVILLLPALAAANDDVPFPGEDGWVPFTDHCYDHRLVPTRSAMGRRFWLLRGTCDVDCEQKPYSLNMNTCIVNNQGRMEWRYGGNYWQSCEGCVITETHGDLFYSCTCTDDPFGASTINLSDKVAWHDQGVKCFLERGRLDDEAWLIGQ